MECYFEGTAGRSRRDHSAENTGMFGDPAHILVRESNWLGDVVMTLPALRALRRRFPAGRLSVLIREDLAGLFDGAPWIDEVIPFRTSGGLRRPGDALRLAAQLRAGAHETAVLFPGSFESALSVFLARIPERVGYALDGRRLLLTKALPLPADDTHEVHEHLGLVRTAFGAEGTPDDLGLEAGETAKATVADWLARHRRAPEGRLIALAPGAAYGPAKAWPANRYASLIDLLARKHRAECVLVGVPAERTKCEEVARASHSEALVAAGETTVAGLVALLSLADGFAGNDSGAMHVAGAVGIPTVGIFGSTSPDKTAPLGPRARPIHHPIECSPCFDRRCRFGHTRCFDPITPEIVADALAGLSAFA